MGICYSLINDDKNKELKIYQTDNTNEVQELLNIDEDDVSYFTFEGTSVYAKVTDVYDGDTCTIIFKVGSKFRKYKLRMYGYDTPEMRPRKTIPYRENIIESAYKARNALRDKILKKIVVVNFFEEDKYGRLLGNVFLDDININKWMIDEGYGYEYFGGTKRK